jgi:hypothetical protein
MVLTPGSPEARVFRFSRAMLLGALAAAGVTCALAQPVASGASEGAPPVSAERQRLAAQVMQSWNPDSLAAKPTTDPAVAAAWAEPLVHDLDPNNARWNATHPKWGAMRDVVVADITPDMEGEIRGLQTRLSDSMAIDMAKRLSEADLAQLLHYFTSPEGRRFVAFQEQITQLFSSSMREALQQERGAAAQPASQDVLKERLQLLMLSSTAQITQSWLEEAQRTHADTSGFQAIGFIAGAVAARRGAELDALRLRYASDLARFDRFNQSPLGKRFFAAFGETSKSVGLSTATMLHTFQRAEEAKYGARWKSAYRAQVPQGDSPAVNAKPVPAPN